MKRTFFILVVYVVCAMAAFGARVEILQIVEHPALDMTRKGVCEALAAAHRKDLQVNYQSAQGSIALAAQIAQRICSQQPDVILVLGTPAAQALIAPNQRVGVPIVFASITDPVGAGLVNDLQHPKMFTGVSNRVPTEKQLQFFKNTLPKLKRLGVLYNPGDANSVFLLKDTERVAQQMGVQVVSATAANTAAVPDAARRLLTSVDALFVNNDNTTLAALPTVIRLANESRLPVFVSDVDCVSQGALAALGADQYALGQQAGKMVLRILDGEKIGLIPVEFPKIIKSVVNEQVSKRFR